VIAIVPQIATSGAPPAAPSSSVSSAGNSGAQSFSAALQQATPSQENSPGMQAGSTQASISGNKSPINDLSTNTFSISGPSKRDVKSSDSKSADSKPADSKTTDSRVHGNASSQASVSRLDVQGSVVPPLVVQPPLAPVLPWNIEIKDLTADDVVTSSTSNDIAAKANVIGVAGQVVVPNATGESNPLPKSPKVEGSAEVQGDANRQDSANTPNVNIGGAGAKASLTENLAASAASDAKAQPGGAAVNSQSRTASRDAANGVSKVQAAVKSEIEQVLVPPAGVPAAPITATAPVPGEMAPGATQGTQAQPAADKSRVSAVQDNLGTTGKNVDTSGNAKAQTRKDDSQSSLSSQTPDQTIGSAPAKTTDATPSFSVAGIQPSPTTGDGKSASVGVPHETGPQAGQPDQKSTGVAQSQAQGENAAAYPTSLVHSAKLVERIGETELRLGIRAGEFGSVDIRTSMVRNQFTAEISVERGELGRVMAAELPNLQNRLSEQRVPIMANITLQNHTGGQSTASEQQKPRDSQPVYAMNLASAREEGTMPALVALEATAPASRLDIHM
jgi:flagellar hook-length control protein FliK